MNVDSPAATTNSTALSSLRNNELDAGVPSRKTAIGNRSHTRLQAAGLPVPANSNKSPRLTSSPHPPFSSPAAGLQRLVNSADSDDLKQLLLDLSKDPRFASHRSTLRLAADQVRIKAFGYNRETTKRKILKLIKEFECIEIEDLVDETNIDDREIKSALIELIEDGKVKEGKRRRWQEPGKHYNPVFYLM
jgi:hypothetical protein